jgi:hypothetical protein
VAAGWAGRNVTLDFSQIGAKIRAWNSITPFFNASIRGSAKTLAELYEHPGTMTMKALLAITIPSVMLYLLNRDDPRWKEVPQWQKDLFWIVFTENTIYRIPKPFELGVIFGSLPERVLEYIDTQDRTVLNEYANSLWNAASPNIVPQVALPIFENLANYNLFLQRPIVPEGVEALPPEYQYGRYTSEVAKELGKMLHYSPAKIDNVFHAWSGGMGDYALQASDAILKQGGIVDVPTGPTTTPADVPVLKAFVVRNPIGSSSRSVSRFYDELEKYQAGERLLKDLMEKGEKDSFEKYRGQHPELLFQYDYDNKLFYSASRRYLTNITNTLADLRKRQDLVYNSRDLSPDDKRRLIDEIDQVKTDLCAKALEKVKDWES